MFEEWDLMGGSSAGEIASCQLLGREILERRWTAMVERGDGDGGNARSDCAFVAPKFRPKEFGEETTVSVKPALEKALLPENGVAGRLTLSFPENGEDAAMLLVLGVGMDLETDLD